MKQDPQAFGYLKGRWVVRDIADALNEEGIPISFKHVHNMLKDLGLSYKRPKLIVRSNDSQYRRKEKQVRNYKASAMLGKKRWFCLPFKWKLHSLLESRRLHKSLPQRREDRR